LAFFLILVPIDSSLKSLKIQLLVHNVKKFHPSDYYLFCIIQIHSKWKCNFFDYII
jgi:hypothetical protein